MKALKKKKKVYIMRRTRKIRKAKQESKDEAVIVEKCT